MFENLELPSCMMKAVAGRQIHTARCKLTTLMHSCKPQDSNPNQNSTKHLRSRQTNKSRATNNTENSKTHAGVAFRTERYACMRIWGVRCASFVQCGNPCIQDQLEESKSASISLVRTPRTERGYELFIMQHDRQVGDRPRSFPRFQ